MGFDHFRHARVMSSGVVRFAGGFLASDDSELAANFASTNPRILITGGGNVAVYSGSAANLFRLYYGAVDAFRFGYSANVSTVEGAGVTGDDIILKCNTVDARPKFTLRGNAGALLDIASGSFEVAVAGVAVANISLGGAGAGGVFKLLETTTPTATANMGALYTKADNHLYFQDGAGAEHDMGSP